MDSGTALAEAQQQIKELYGDFCDADFDAAAYARRAAGGDLAGGSADRIAEVMAELARRAQELDSVVRQAVVEAHEELFQQVVGVKQLDASLGQVEEQVREIKGYMHGLRTKIRVPYEQAQTYTWQSRNLHAAIGQVRAVSKFIQLVRRLQAQMPEAEGGADYALAALTLLDIDKVVGGSDLRGIRVVDEALAQAVAGRRERTVGVAEALIDAGMRQQHQGDVAGGLQVLFNLGELAPAVAARVRRCTVAWAGHVAGRLDPRALHAHVREHNARATAGDGSDMVGIDSVLWARLEALVDELLARGLELRVLERVLLRKRDALPRFEVSVGALDGPRADAAAGVSFLDVVAGELGDRPLAFWWGTAVNALAAEVGAACAGSTVIQQILTNGYPRLVQLFVPRLERILAPRLGGVVSANEARSDHGPRVLWDQLLGRFEADYVAKAASRIEDAVGRCYPPPPPPGLLDAHESRGRAADLERMAAVNLVPNRRLVAGVVRSIATELELAKSDPRLCAAVAGAAAAAIQSFVDITKTKVAGILVSPGVLDPLASPPSPLTKSYVGLVNAVDALRTGVAEIGGQDAAAPLPRAAAHRLRRQSRFSSAHSSLAGSPGSPGLADDAGANSAQHALCDCLFVLAAFVDEHINVLLGAADAAVVAAIVDGHGGAGGPEPPAERAMQWLQAQVVEVLEPDCQPRVATTVDRLMRLCVRAVCLAFPLTEDENLRLTAELTQFEFAASQLVAAAGASARGRGSKLTLDALGRSYQALRLMRPLLFTRSAELATVLAHLPAGDWRCVPIFDLLDHVVCRAATEVDAQHCLPTDILRCSRRQWIAAVSACEGLQVPAGDAGPAVAGHAAVMAALGESLKMLSACCEQSGSEDIAALIDAAQRAIKSG
ncbi:Conserved oligomeric Golgi complex subunit [Coemansia nantahalensis]|uniref:Conserved oligomeric Golgi complex subunit n=1 Tax=Coemansia nantahalensis TaxID=2789366 RepID=A0ACC1JZQ5_9FUNG|nr:Conserved oligomeric Golgi complex subunit [Coemansia nantahalensis]